MSGSRVAIVSSSQACQATLFSSPEFGGFVQLCPCSCFKRGAVRAFRDLTMPFEFLVAFVKIKKKTFSVLVLKRQANKQRLYTQKNFL
jgi:hypothetical protein